jgi:hypothetical protein
VFEGVLAGLNVYLLGVLFYRMVEFTINFTQGH